MSRELHFSDAYQKRLSIGKEVELRGIFNRLEDLSDDQRLLLFSNYCRHCGDKDPGCQCWNDE